MSANTKANGLVLSALVEKASMDDEVVNLNSLNGLVKELSTLDVTSEQISAAYSNMIDQLKKKSK